MTALGVAELGVEPIAGYPYAGGPNHSWFPLLLLEEAFTTEAFAESPNFVDIGIGSVRAFSTRRGRSSDLDRPAAGSSRFTVDVRDRVLDPANTASPYYPNIVPNRRVRLRALADGVTWPIFEGFADAHNVTYEIPRDAVCELPCTDGFKLLARAKLTTFGARPIEKTSARVAAILDHVGWPASRRSISTGSAIVAASADSGDNGPYRDMSALDAILDLDGTENGRTVVDAAGVFTFLSRQDMNSSARQTTAQAVLSDTGAAGTIPYSSIEFENSETLLYNSVTVSAHDGDVLDEQLVEDADSIDEHGLLSYGRSVWDATESAMRATAEWILESHKDPMTRVLGVTVPTSRSTATYTTGLYSTVFALRLGDRVTVVRTPPGGGSAISQDCWVESIAHRANATQRSWTTQFGFAYAPPAVAYGKWGTAKWNQSKWAY